YCNTLTIVLNGVGSGKKPTTQSLQFFVAPEKELSLTVTPLSLLPGATQILQTVVKDQTGAVITSASIPSLQISGQPRDAAGVPKGNAVLFTLGSSGVYAAAIPSLAEGDSVLVTASASSFISFSTSVPITANTALTFSDAFGCLTFTPEFVDMTIGGSASLTISSLNCPGPVQLYTHGTSDSQGNTIAVTAKLGTNTVQQSSPVTLNATDSKTLILSSPPYMGSYPLFVKAKYSNDAAFSFIRNIDVTVSPSGLSTTCVIPSTFVFDLTGGSDAAQFINVCNPGVHHPLLPSATLSIDQTFSRVVSSFTTPELSSPGTPLSFKWNASVDHNASLNT
ncbi:MAG: hypothetical protein AABY11_01675, partial [archaeon]